MWNELLPKFAASPHVMWETDGQRAESLTPVVSAGLETRDGRDYVVVRGRAWTWEADRRYVGFTTREGHACLTTQWGGLIVEVANG